MDLLLAKMVFDTRLPQRLFRLQTYYAWKFGRLVIFLHLGIGCLVPREPKNQFFRSTSSSCIASCWRTFLFFRPSFVIVSGLG